MRQQLVHGSIFSLASKFTETLLSLAIVILLARLLGAEGYGTYAFVLAVVSLASMPTRLGLPPLVVRETARGQATGSWKIVAGIWRWSTRATLAISLIIAIVGFGVITSAKLWEDQVGSTLLVALFLVPLLSLAALRGAMLRGLRHVTAANIAALLVQPALLVCLLLVGMSVIDTPTTPAQAMVLTVISALGAFAVGTWIMAQKRPTEVARAQPQYESNSWLAAAWPMAMTQGAHQFNRYTDVLILGLLASMVDAGVYRVAAQGAIVVSLGMTALGLVTAPYIARLHEQGLRSDMQRLVRRSAQASFGFALAVTVAFAAIGFQLLQWLFGGAFQAAWLPLMILSGGHAISTAIGPTGMVLNMTGHERAVTRAVLVAALVNISLNLLLIPFFGVIGAATATAISLVFWKTWLWFTAYGKLGIRCSAL